MGIVYLFLSGIFNSIMVSFNGQLGNYHSLFVVTFIVHVIAAIILFIYSACPEKKDKADGSPSLRLYGRYSRRHHRRGEQLVYGRHRSDGCYVPLRHGTDGMLGYF